MITRGKTMGIDRRTVALMVTSTILSASGCGGRSQPASPGLASSEAVTVLKAPDSPYRIIYHAAVDLTKRPPDAGAKPKGRATGRSTSAAARGPS